MGTKLEIDKSKLANVLAVAIVIMSVVIYACADNMRLDRLILSLVLLASCVGGFFYLKLK